MSLSSNILTDSFRFSDYTLLVLKGFIRNYGRVYSAGHYGFNSIFRFLAKFVFSRCVRRLVTYSDQIAFPIRINVIQFFL